MDRTVSRMFFPYFHKSMDYVFILIRARKTCCTKRSWRIIPSFTKEDIFFKMKKVSTGTFLFQLALNPETSHEQLELSVYAFSNHLN